MYLLKEQKEKIWVIRVAWYWPWSAMTMMPKENILSSTFFKHCMNLAVTSNYLFPFHIKVPSNLLSKLLGGSQMISPSKLPSRPSSCPISAVSIRHTLDFKFVSLKYKKKWQWIQINIYILIIIW